MAETPSDTAVANSETGDNSSQKSSSNNAIEGQRNELPENARGVLRIRVPLRVTLASQRKSVKEITELGPGSIIKFDKTCDQPMDLTVVDKLLAHGEVVKVGDKFGLRISGFAK